MEAILRKAKNWTGVSQGRLQIGDKLHERGKYGDRYVANCGCGNTTVVEANNLTAGTSSCGCAQRDASRAANQTHGQSNTRLYSRWTTMLRRSRNPRLKVEVIPAWYEWETFKADIGDVPDNTCLKRVDTSKPFGPDNIQIVKVAA